MFNIIESVWHTGVRGGGGANFSKNVTYKSVKTLQKWPKLSNPIRSLVGTC